MKIASFHLLEQPPGLADADVIANQLAQIRLAEELGFDTAWIGEHHFSAYGIAGNPFVFATAAAMQTSRIRIGLGVVVLPFHHPAMVAESAAMLDHLSGGRLEFGIGSGSQPFEIEGMGVAVDEAKPRFYEIHDIVKRFWCEGTIRHEGQFFRIDNDEVRPMPLQRPHPPIWVAATAPASVEWTARHRYGLMTSGIFGPFSQTLAVRDVYTATLRAMGDSEPQIQQALGRWAASRYIHVAETDQQARADVIEPVRWAREIAETIRGPRDWSKLSPETAANYRARMERSSKAREAIQFDQYRDEIMIVGSPETVLPKVQAMVDCGVGELITWLNFGGMDHDKVTRSMRLLMEEVVPRLKDRRRTNDEGRRTNDERN